MKKKLKLFCAVVLISALGAGFTACNDETDDYKIPKNGVKPVLSMLAGDADNEANKEIVAFFDENVGRITQAIFHEDDITPFTDTCVMINSTDEFMAMVSPSVVLPEIDFDKYTLLVGRYVVGHGGFELVSQYIIAGQEKVTMNLILELRGDIYSLAVERHFIWGLYPKVTSRAIDMNVVKK